MALPGWLPPGLAHFDGTQVVEVITSTLMGLGEKSRVLYTSDGTLVTTYPAMARRPP
jgi:hypothetical protein